eukprot:434062_1
MSAPIGNFIQNNKLQACVIGCSVLWTLKRLSTHYFREETLHILDQSSFYLGLIESCWIKSGEIRSTSSFKMDPPQYDLESLVAEDFSTIEPEK